MAQIHRTCFMCDRVGTRGFHEVRWGMNKGKYRCTASIACDKRVWRKVGKAAGWKW
ncbi:hypothetical protein KHO57_gp048 [Mycobacterium phage Phabba]|uniref:Uncharacterized protein n=1 Tax=Mycobacterium phage Phabba TaxID=2027899 RepID=A0A249XSA6_9CAUD|nr:hypothetical protein KHO57_gp048 [Mycobacterium phage Phabba]ASZ74623.1 hypothetical protein SEA_PHABBA_48 [Mycobacterium phage Phabba]